MRKACVLGVMAIVLALPQVVLGAPSNTPPPNCNQVYDPTAYTQSALAACGIPTYPLSGTTQLPDGGTSYNYDLGDGGTFSLPIPPAGFDPVTAPDSELALYGLASRPPQTDLNRFAAWAAAFTNTNWSTPPPWVATLNLPAHTLRSGNWAGFDVYGYDMPDHFTEIYGDYAEPQVFTDSCGSAQDVGWWAGLGGIADWLAQDGTGKDPNAGHFAWVQVWNDQAKPDNKLNTTLSLGQIDAGDIIFDDVIWRPNESEFAGNVTDETTNREMGWIYTNSNAHSGKSAEMIMDRGTNYQLAHFAPWNVQPATINNSHTFSDYSSDSGSDPVRERDVLGDGTASTSFLNGDGSFSVTWNSCN